MPLCLHLYGTTGIDFFWTPSLLGVPFVYVYLQVFCIFYSSSFVFVEYFMYDLNNDDDSVTVFSMNWALLGNY